MSTDESTSLEARNVRVAFRGLVALDGVDIELQRGEILGLIGPNGAGKTTVVNVLSGYVRPALGEVVLAGAAITRRPPAHRARLGLARTFQGTRLFGRLTVWENIEAAALGAVGSRRRARQRTGEVLKRMQLRDRAEIPASQLSYGEAQRVGIARALSTAPTFVLLDEPAAGLDEEETRELDTMLSRIRGDFGLGMLVIEHDMSLIMGLCDRVQVLVEGRSVAMGRPSEIQNDPEVRRAYLGLEPEQEDDVVARH